MSAHDWIHCNKCYTRFNKDLKFFLTGCGHLNCQKCIIMFENNGKKCTVCNASTKCVMLTNELPKDMLAYFQSLDEAVEQLKKIIKFQTRNMMSLLNIMSNKYNMAKDEVMKCYKIINDLKKENHRLKSLMKNHSLNGAGSTIGIGSEISPRGFNASTPMSFNTSTPMSHHIPSSPSLGNSTLISSIHSRASSGMPPHRPGSQYLYPNSTKRRYY